MDTILITGGAGFIGSYLCQEFLEHDYRVRIVDNFSKYGKIHRAYFRHPNFELIEGDCLDPSVINLACKNVSYVIANAAMIGGISYFHKHAYDLLATNERILANTFDSCISHFESGPLRRIIVMSSSMVFESATNFPSFESDVREIPPPESTYGFQKLSCEYFAKGAFDQYGLPFTIARPFNCVGIGEGRSLSTDEHTSGDIKLAMSHVLPDLAQKSVRGQNPLRILGSGNQIRCYTHGADIARALRLIVESEAATNETFNISTSRATSVLELAEMVWKEVNPSAPFKYASDEPFPYDVQRRVPDVSKAKNILNFESEISLESAVKEVVVWVKKAVKSGEI